MAEVSARQFNKDVSAAKRAAEKGPVIITSRGQPSHVLLSIGEYRRLTANERSVVDWLSSDDTGDLDVERLELGLKGPDL